VSFFVFVVFVVCFALFIDLLTDQVQPLSRQHANEQKTQENLRRLHQRQRRAVLHIQKRYRGHYERL
jgi:hypothetical protein